MCIISYFSNGVTMSYDKLQNLSEFAYASSDMNSEKIKKLERLSEFFSASGIDSFKVSCELSDKVESNNNFFISEKITKEIQVSVLPLLNEIFTYLDQVGIKEDQNMRYANIVGGVYVENNEVFGLDFTFPYADQVVSFDFGEGRLLRMSIKNIPEIVSINFTMTENGTYNDVGIIEYNKETISFKSPQNFNKDGKKQFLERSRKFFIILSMVKVLFEKLLNKKYKYELRQPTKAMKKRKVQPIKTSFKYISLDYMSLDEIKTLFKYESRNIKGTEKSPHDRASHIRKLKSGKEIVVKSSKVRGGASVSKLTHIK